MHKRDRVTLAFSFSIGKKISASGKTRQSLQPRGEHQHAWTYIQRNWEEQDHSFGSFSGGPGIVRLETFMKTLTNLLISSLMYKYTQKRKWMSIRHASTMRALTSGLMCVFQQRQRTCWSPNMTGQNMGFLLVYHQLSWLYDHIEARIFKRRYKCHAWII